MNKTSMLLMVAGGTLLLVVISYFPGGTALLKQHQPAAQIITPFILIATVWMLRLQLGHIEDQNELQRAVASKSAIQELNKVLLDEKQKDFLRFLFPHVKESNDESNPSPEEKQARETMMAFSLMNSLEMLYLTQKEHVSREDFKRLLRGFTGNVRDIWNDEFATVYHPAFQEIVEEVFAEN